MDSLGCPHGLLQALCTFRAASRRAAIDPLPFAAKVARLVRLAARVPIDPDRSMRAEIAKIGREIEKLRHLPRDENAMRELSQQRL